MIELLIAALATEAITNLLTKSEFSVRFIKKPLFKQRHRFYRFIHDILDCGYCTSVWAAILPTFYFLTGKLEWLMILLIVHRLSNILHFIIDWLDEKRSRDFEFNSEGEDNERLRKEHDAFVGPHDEEVGGAGSNNSSG
jgi:hypothetical protein